MRQDAPGEVVERGLVQAPTDGDSKDPPAAVPGGPLSRRAGVAPFVAADNNGPPAVSFASIAAKVAEAEAAEEEDAAQAPATEPISALPGPASAIARDPAALRARKIAEPLSAQAHEATRLGRGRRNWTAVPEPAPSRLVSEADLAALTCNGDQAGGGKSLDDVENALLSAMSTLSLKQSRSAHSRTFLMLPPLWLLADTLSLSLPTIPCARALSSPFARALPLESSHFPPLLSHLRHSLFPDSSPLALQPVFFAGAATSSSIG